MLVSNLLDNAVKFSPPGGIADVELGVGSGTAMIRIVDSGPDIERTERERVERRAGERPRTSHREDDCEADRGIRGSVGFVAGWPVLYGGLQPARPPSSARVRQGRTSGDRRVKPQAERPRRLRSVRKRP